MMLHVLRSRTVDYIAVDTREGNKYEYLLQVCGALDGDRVTLKDECKGIVSTWLRSAWQLEADGLTLDRC